MQIGPRGDPAASACSISDVRGRCLPRSERRGHGLRRCLPWPLLWRLRLVRRRDMCAAKRSRQTDSLCLTHAISKKTPFSRLISVCWMPSHPSAKQMCSLTCFEPAIHVHRILCACRQLFEAERTLMCFCCACAYLCFYCGVSVCAVTMPVDVVKTRLQMDGAGGSQKLYKGSLDCATNLVKAEGPSSLFKGLPPALVRQSTYGSLRYGLYSPIRDALGAWRRCPEHLATALA
eukprot:5598503-Pleurochrysis_carterae.AAC.2